MLWWIISVRFIFSYHFPLCGRHGERQSPWRPRIKIIHKGSLIGGLIIRKGCSNIMIIPRSYRLGFYFGNFGKNSAERISTTVDRFQRWRDDTMHTCVPPALSTCSLLYLYTTAAFLLFPSLVTFAVYISVDTCESEQMFFKSTVTRS